MALHSKPVPPFTVRHSYRNLLSPAKLLTQSFTDESTLQISGSIAYEKLASPGLEEKAVVEGLTKQKEL